MSTPNYTKKELISIHSLVKRETRSGIHRPAGTVISIHSLVKRETVEMDNQAYRQANFNPLPRKEGDEKDCGR